jgi:hypothetical protein
LDDEEAMTKMRSGGSGRFSIALARHHLRASSSARFNHALEK